MGVFRPATVRWDGPLATAAAQEAATRGLQAAAEYIKSVAVPITPIRDGILRGSAGTDVDPDAQRASIFYDTPYAVEQHENLTFRHREGQAKYLETAVDEAGRDAVDIIAAQIRRALR